MLYGRKNMEERMVEAVAGTSGYAAWEAAFGHSLPVGDSFEFSLKLLIAGMKDLEGK